MPPKAKAKAASKQNALQAEGWCCSGGSGADVGGPVFGTVCCSLDWLRSFGPPLYDIIAEVCKGGRTPHAESIFKAVEKNNSSFPSC